MLTTITFFCTVFRFFCGELVSLVDFSTVFSKAAGLPYNSNNNKIQHIWWDIMSVVYIRNGEFFVDSIRDWYELAEDN